MTKQYVALQKKEYFQILFFVMLALAAVLILTKHTRTYDDKKESVTVFFEKIECRRRNFPVLPLGADPIDIPSCGSVGKVKSIWNEGE